jgi:hypothetical protein
LKLGVQALLEDIPQVAPHAGAWIETLSSTSSASMLAGRPPRGGVD